MVSAHSGANGRSQAVIRLHDTGTPTVQNGGAVSSIDGYVGISPDTNGTVTVDSTGSGALNIGAASPLPAAPPSRSPARPSHAMRRWWKPAST